MTLRQSQSVLHTWSGLLLGWILFGIFLAGTVSFWREEISRWTRPELAAGFDRVAVLEGATRFLATKAPGAQSWTIDLPDRRGAGTLVRWQPQPKAGEKPRIERGFRNSQWIDGTGHAVQVRETRGGDFFYRLHFDLHYLPVFWARCFVGLCSMFMLVAIVSGVITHKKIFRDFFTFRPRKGQRSWLDGHNATAVLALPFHFMITYTGLVTLMGMYMPWGALANYPSMQAFYAEQFPRDAQVDRAGRPAPLPALAGLASRAEEQWNSGHAGLIRIEQPGDAAQQVVIIRDLSDRVAASDEPVRFNGTTGALVQNPRPEGAGAVVRAAMIGLHAGRFSDLALRWLYFLSSVAGTLMVASGLVLWTMKRRQRLPDPARTPLGFRVVERLNVAFIGGMPLAMTGFLWANRLLPIGMTGRMEAEINCMFLLWGAALAWSLAASPVLAWAGLLTATAVSLAALAAADLVLTDSGLVASLWRGDTAMAAMEAGFLVLAAIFAWMGRRVWRRTRAPAAARAIPARELTMVPAE